MLAETAVLVMVHSVRYRVLINTGTIAFSVATFFCVLLHTFYILYYCLSVRICVVFVDTGHPLVLHQRLCEVLCT